MRLHHGFFAGEMFVGRDLIGQLVLLNGSGIAGRLGRPRGVLANLVFETVWHSRYFIGVKCPSGIDLPGLALK